MTGVTLDAGPLIGLDRNRRQVIALLAVAAETGGTITIPGSALAQAIRNPSRQARLARLLRQPRTDVVPLDRVDATHVGRLLAASGTSDIADAHVVVCGRRARQTIVTSDPDDLRALDPDVDLITV
ncbi:MAG: PIN domain-containing protein [Gordonia amarae]